MVYKIHDDYGYVNQGCDLILCKTQMEQYIVVTALKTGTWSETKDGQDPIRNYIEELVQRRSRIESYANSRFCNDVVESIRK